MKQGLGILLFVSLVLLAFQNCNTSAFHSELSAVNSSLSSAQQIEKLNLGNLQFGAIQLYSKSNKIIQTNGQSIQVRINQILEINLDTGEAIVSNDYDNNIELRCLTEDQVTEAKSMFSRFEFCRFNKVLPNDTACALIYKLPYARLMTSTEDLDLGAASDSCESSVVDLCESHKPVFMAWIAQIQNNISNYTCQ